MNTVQGPIPPTNMPGFPAGQETQVLPLRDIRLPAEPGFWPLAPGWWFLTLVLVVLVIWLVIKWYKYSVKKRRWQAINQQLAKLEFTYQQDKDKQHLLTGISAFLRRFVKYQLNESQATALSGNSWISYLNQFHQAEPFAAYETALTSGVYQADCVYDADGLIQVTREFIKQQVMKPINPLKVKTNSMGHSHV